MFSELTTGMVVANAWLVTFAVALLCLAASGFAFFARGRLRRTPARLSLCLAALLPATLVVTDILDRLQDNLDNAALLVGKALLLLLFCVGQGLLFTMARSRKIERPWFRFSTIVTLWMLILAGWSWHRFHDAIKPRDEEDLAESYHLMRREVTDTIALTDRQRPVKLLIAAYDSTLDSLQLAPLNQYSERLIKQGPADASFNCHGWVFAEGQFVLQGVDVELILVDNAYEPVTEPRENDLVVYRSPGGTIVHTGVVRVVDHNGLVLIESKWGLQARYLHHPEDQGYSESFVYYRSPRTGHVLQFAAAPLFRPPPRPRL